jgi:hypothetical protein
MAPQPARWNPQGESHREALKAELRYFVPKPVGTNPFQLNWQLEKSVKEDHRCIPPPADYLPLLLFDVSPTEPPIRLIRLQ